MQDHIFGIDPRRQGSIHLNAAHLKAGEGHGLGGQDIPQLAGADPKGDGPKGSVGGGVAISTSDGHARLSQPQLWPNHMDNPLMARFGLIILDAKVLGVLL